MKPYTYFRGGKLSNFYKSPFCDTMGVQYLHMEQYMMAQKAKLFNDMESYEKIMAETDPMQCKLLGRDVQNWNQKVWDKNKYHIVHAGCMLKFQQDIECKAYLLNCPGLIVEIGPDEIWGIGIYQKEAEALGEENWPGQNLLGKILTDVRDCLLGKVNYLTTPK